MIEEITVYKSDLDPDFTFYTKNEAVKFEETYKVFYDLDEELQGIIKKCYAKEIDKSAAQDAAIDIFYNKAKPALLKRVESFSAINLVQFNATTVERGSRIKVIVSDGIYDVFKDYGFEDASLFLYTEVGDDGKEVTKDLTFPDFYDEAGEEVNTDRLKDFLVKVENWKKTNEENS